MPWVQMLWVQLLWVQLLRLRFDQADLRGNRPTPTPTIAVVRHLAGMQRNR